MDKTPKAATSSPETALSQVFLRLAQEEPDDSQKRQLLSRARKANQRAEQQKPT